MTALFPQLGETFSPAPIRTAFLKWQCRVRQIAMRDHEGRPNDGMMPEIFLGHQQEPIGSIITIMNKLPAYGVTPELRHMIAKTNDPAQRRSQALTFFSASHYQKAAEFSDILTATFQPGSSGAARMVDAVSVRLVFQAFAQMFDLTCKAFRLPTSSSLYQATIAHNMLFNPRFDPGSEVLAFEPDWEQSSSMPEFR